MNNGYHEQLHHDVLVYVTRPVLVVVGDRAVVIVIVSVLQSIHQQRVRRKTTHCNLSAMHWHSQYFSTDITCCWRTALFCEVSRFNGTTVLIPLLQQPNPAPKYYTIKWRAVLLAETKERNYYMIWWSSVVCSHDHELPNRTYPIKDCNSLIRLLYDN